MALKVRGWIGLLVLRCVLSSVETGCGVLGVVDLIDGALYAGGGLYALALLWLLSKAAAGGVLLGDVAVSSPVPPRWCQSVLLNHRGVLQFPVLCVVDFLGWH